MARTKKDPNAPKKTPLTPEQKAERLERRKARKEARAAKNAQLELTVASSKEAHPDVWASVDAFRESIKAVRASIENVPEAERPTVSMAVGAVLRNLTRPSRMAKAQEKLRKRLARLDEARAKLLAELG